MRNFKLLVLFCIISSNISAQEMWGFSNSNFSGNMGMQLNPSTIVAAPYKSELHFFSMDLFAQNTYIYLPAESNVIWNAIKGKLSNEKNFFDVYRRETQSGFGHASVIGPSFISSNEREAWGIHTAFRNELSALDVPSPLAKYIYERYDYEPFVNQRFIARPFSVAYMSWAEIGGTYGKAIVENEKNYLKAAATGNFLLGFDGMFLDARQLDNTVLDSSTVIMHAMDATIGHALEDNGQTGFGNFIKLRGVGMSTTLGLTYIRHRSRAAFDCSKAADQVRKYHYRVGVSLIDFGMIRFSNQAKILELGLSRDQAISHLDTIRFQSFNNLDLVLNEKVNRLTGSASDQSFAMFLPAAFSVQFDYSFTSNFYGNVSLLNRIYYSPMEVARGNQLNVSFRYEKKGNGKQQPVSRFSNTLIGDLESVSGMEH